MLVIPFIFILVKQIFILRQSTALLEQRTCALEAAVKEMPGHDLSVGIAQLNGEINALQQVMKGLNSTVSRHEEFLLSQGGRR